MAKDFTEFEKIRRQRAKKKLIKKLNFTLIIFLMLILVYFFYKNDYHTKIVDNINSICKILKRGPGYPVNVNMTDIKDKTRLGSQILILDEDIIYIFNESGYKTLYQKHGLNNPRVASNKKDRAVAFEHLGKNLKIYSKTSKLFEKQLDDVIYNISVASDGKVAVMKGASRFVSGLEILDRSYGSIFKWNSADKYITLCEFSKNNKNFAVASMKVENAQYVSTINFFNINRENKISEIILNDDIIVSMKYRDDDLYVIGEKSAYIIDGKFNIKKQYKYKERLIKAYDNDSYRNLILIFDNYNQTPNNNVILLNNRLEQINEYKFDGKLKDITSNEKEFFVLTDEDICKFNFTSTSNNFEKYSVSSVITNIIAVNNKLYYFNVSKLDILKQYKNNLNIK